jgi:UDP-N-acetyl-D-mannosaminuronic acid dehydrogenase
MPQILNLTPQDLDSSEKRSKYTVGIIGCGQKGILYANAFAAAGYRVLCIDSDPSVVKKVAKGKTPFNCPDVEAKLKSNITKGQISINSDFKKVVSQSEILVIAFTAKKDEQTKTDTSHTVHACKQVGEMLQKGTLVIYGGIAGLGFTEGTIKETLEDTSGFKAGKDFALVYNPIQTTNGAITELTVAANDQASLQTASTVLKTLTSNVKEISNIKTAEILTLFSIAKKDVNMALANELANFCEKANIDYFEVLNLLAPNDPSFWATITEEENKNEAYLMLESAENLNAKLRLPALARQINEDMLKHAVNLTQEALRSCNKTLRRSRVTVFGPADQPAMEVFVKQLEAKGAKVCIYDPTAKKETPNTMVKTGLNDSVEGADCLIVLSGQGRFSHFNFKKLRPMMKSKPVIVDLIGKFNPQDVRTEGFIYCGLGRGTG